MKNNKLRCTAPRSEDAELRAMQAEIERTNTRLHEVATLCATVEQERDAALARLAEIENQEPAYLLTPDGKCYAYGSAQPLSAGHADATLLKLYAAAGASLVATPIVAWAKSTPRKLRITTMDMGGEDGWRPLGYTAARAALEAADALEAAQAENDVQTKAANHWMAEANKSHNLTVTQQAEIERLNGYVQKANMDVTAACVERDKALARIAKLEPKRNVSPPSEELVLKKMRYHFWEADDDEPADFELFDAGVECDTCIDVALVRQDRLDELIAAAGASPQQSPLLQFCTCEDCKLMECEGCRINRERRELLPAPGEAAREYMTGYSDGREWAQPSQAPQGCACRWDADDNRIATCTRHQGWLDVVQEWADRAKVAEAKLAQPPAPSDTAIKHELMQAEIDGLRERLVELEKQEPIAYLWKNCEGCYSTISETQKGAINVIAVYASAGASPVEPLTKTQIEKGMMALLWCAASDLERLNPNMYEGYKDDVTRVYSAITTETTRNS